MDRKQEVRALLALSPDEVIERGGSRLVVCDTIDDLHERFARDVAEEIRANNDGD